MAAQAEPSPWGNKPYVGIPGCYTVSEEVEIQSLVNHFQATYSKWVLLPNPVGANGDFVESVTLLLKTLRDFVFKLDAFALLDRAEQIDLLGEAMFQIFAIWAAVGYDSQNDLWPQCFTSTNLGMQKEDYQKMLGDPLYGFTKEFIRNMKEIGIDQLMGALLISILVYRLYSKVRQEHQAMMWKAHVKYYYLLNKYVTLKFPSWQPHQTVEKIFSNLVKLNTYEKMQPGAKMGTTWKSVDDYIYTQKMVGNTQPQKENCLKK